MKIMALCGSPRDYGNSTAVLKYFLQATRKKTTQSWLINLEKLRYKGCTGCYACKRDYERCALNDGLTSVLAAIEICDILLIATPLYFGELPGQLKMVIDRTFSFLVPGFNSTKNPSRLKPGKKLIMVLLQAHPNPAAYAKVFKRYNVFMEQQGFRDNILIQGYGMDLTNSLEKNSKLRAQLDEVATVL